jgi:hypothetical protein
MCRLKATVARRAKRLQSKSKGVSRLVWGLAIPALTALSSMPNKSAASTAFIRTNDDLEEGDLGGFGVDGGVFRQARAQATHRGGVDPERCTARSGG